jgi:hypothetical protein
MRIPNVTKAAILAVLFSFGSAGQCLDSALRTTVEDVVRWRSFWFAFPSGETFSAETAMVRSNLETAVLLPSIDVRILIPRHRQSGGAPMDITVASSKDLASDLRSYKASLPSRTRRGQVAPAIESECMAHLRGIILAPPQSQTTPEVPSGFVTRASIYAKEIVQSDDCPCEVWIAYSMPSEAQGFGMVKGRQGYRRFFGYYWDGVSDDFGFAWTPLYSHPPDDETRLMESRILRGRGYSGSFDAGKRPTSGGAYVYDARGKQ